jgi:hypothetical protein
MVFARMTPALHFTVPLEAGWADRKRHSLGISCETVSDYANLLPNPGV